MSIISESLKEAYKLNEASLTPEEKMDAWHNGERRENIRACGDIKLKKYLEICKEKGYLEQAKIISDELKHRSTRDSSSSPSTSPVAAHKDPIIIMSSSGKPIFKTLDEKEAENFFMTHATAIRCSDPELLMQWQRKSLEKDATKGYLEARMAGDKLVLWPTDYICGLLDDLMGHRDAVLDFGYRAGDDKIIIPKTHKYANKVASAILKIIDKESKDYNI